ncbi:ABC transporter substrate-binding protein [Lacicoccus qingdaonensis]|uniref:Carbohydrate ABC transporter substrate-binding protein, CUT1 family n=1 Tax=Lacicoccus qingdaonensis TaxID=576118 RepID=A0A1G9EJK8_9BACL|nr:ABC transporter substrate-binding protein [Salinicoccus qingdaonensis]SDK76279.1 carbohydrate ABC transporter substrate-binding protein, CUT1 family [Salinicoccus qingdaonensis]
MNKKLLSFLMLIVVTVVLAACNGDSGNSDGAGEENGDTGEASSGDTEGSEDGEASDDGTEITFWHAMSGPHQDAITELTDAFNESQDDYTVVEQNQGDYETLNQSIMASGVSDDLPTLAQATSSNIPDWASNDLIVPLDDLLSEHFDPEIQEDIFQGFLEGATYQDEIMAMPFSKSVRVLYVNDDIVEELGVEVPETWEEIQEIGSQMSEDGDERFAMGLEATVHMELETMARQNGAEWISDDLSTVDIGGEAAVEPMQFIADGVEEGWMRTAGEDGFMSGPFSQGEILFYIGSSAGLAHVAPAAEENDVSWSTAELPVYGGGDPLTLLAGNDLTVFSSASDEEQQGAMAFMEFLLQPENTAKWAMDTGYVPVTNAGVESEDYQEYLEENPRAEAAALETEYATASPLFVGSGEYWDLMTQAQDNMLIDGEDVQDTMQTLEEETVQIIEENN